METNPNQEPTGDDLLTTFSLFDVSLRKLSANVVRAWFDTDCKDTRSLLNWVATSLTDCLYLSPLDRLEIEKLSCSKKNSNDCHEQKKCNQDFSEVFNVTENEDETAYCRSEITVFEDEHKRLEELISIYQSLDDSISTELSIKKNQEIQFIVECKSAQDACEDLCKNLDELNRKRYDRLAKYDPDSHLVSFIDTRVYYENINTISCLLASLTEVDQALIETTDDSLNEELEICKGRILRSQQIYLVNQVEMEKLKKLLDFLSTVNSKEYHVSWSLLGSQANLAAKEAFKKHILEDMGKIGLRTANYFLRETKVLHMGGKLESCEKEFKNACRVLDYLTKYLSYYVLTNCLQLIEKKDIECIGSFYQKMLQYVEGDLSRCRSRTEQMKEVIEDYNLYRSKDVFERCPVIPSVLQVIGSHAISLESAVQSVRQFRAELNSLRIEVFSPSFAIDDECVRAMRENIKVFEEYLKSGPTDKIILIPTDLQKVQLEVEDHLKKEKDNLNKLVQLVKSQPISMLTPSQKYQQQLWMSFLTEPSNVNQIIQQAEEDFMKRNCQYF